MSDEYDDVPLQMYELKTLLQRMIMFIEPLWSRLAISCKVQLDVLASCFMLSLPCILIELQRGSFEDLRKIYDCWTQWTETMRTTGASPIEGVQLAGVRDDDEYYS